MNEEAGGPRKNTVSLDRWEKHSHIFPLVRHWRNWGGNPRPPRPCFTGISIYECQVEKPKREPDPAKRDVEHEPTTGYSLHQPCYAGEINSNLTAEDRRTP